MIYAIIIALLVVLFVFLYYQNNHLVVTEYQYYSKFINNEFIAVQLSDLHSKPFYSILNKLETIKPDVILITGDYINDKNANKDKMLEFGKMLLKIAPIYYITGNHEKRLDSFDDLMQELQSIGFNVLLNKEAVANIKNNEIVILGLDENQASFEAYKQRKKGIFKYKDMSIYFEKLDKYNNKLKIVLSHFPENFELVKENSYAKYNFDVQFSGHAHGGQFILPFIGPVLSPGQGLFPKYAKGSFGNRPKLIISRGLGNSEFPFRLFNYPEINVVTFKPNNKTSID